MANLIMVGVLIFCNIIIAFTSSLASRPHNYVIIENTFPPDKVNDPRVLFVASSYRKRLFQLALVMSLITLLLLTPLTDSIFMLLFFVFLFLSLGSMYWLQIRYIRKMHQLIVDNQWELTTAPIQIDTRLTLEKNRKIVAPWWFAVSFVLIFASNLYLYLQERTSFSTVMALSSLFIWGLFILIWLGIRHLPAKNLTDDQEINRRYNDLARFYWSFLTIGMSLILPIILFLPALSIFSDSRAFIFLTIFEFALLLFFMFFTFWWLLQLRKKQDQLLNQTASFRYNGEDYYWRYGFYYNPDDRRLMIPDRIGMNLGVNMAKLGGKLSMLLIAIILLVAMIVTVVPLYILDYHPDPFTATVTQQSISLDGPFVSERRIDFDKIEKVELVDQLSGKILKTAGMATNDYELGSFTVDGQTASLFVINDSQPILKITTKQRIYYYTNKTPAKTQTVYAKLLSHR